MAAKDTAKTPQPRASQSNDTTNEMHVKDENEKVSLDGALEAIQQAQELLKQQGETEKEWQDPVELLNITAAALDEAALALKTINNGEKQVRRKDEKALLLDEYCQQVLEGRQAILDATQQVVAGKRPTELWNPNSLIVYASHTGTSETFALELQTHLGGADVMNIKDVSLLDLQERKRVYFICSTFGLGRPPRDAEVVYTTLQLLDTTAVHHGDENDKDALVAATESQALVGLEVAVAALGNSKFESFCKFGHDLSDRLCALGAQQVLPLAELDRRNGKEDQLRQFRQWQQQVFALEGVVQQEKPINDASIIDKSSPAKSTCCNVM